MKLFFRSLAPIGSEVLVMTWLLASFGGAWWLAARSSRPGESATASSQWPAGARIVRAPHGLTVVMFVHPRCACSHATLAELARVMSRSGGRMVARVLFYRPLDAISPWEKTDLWRQASIVPGVSVAWDEGGKEAGRFGAQTSGHAFVFDAAGALRFRGGITAARGHEGGNPGSDGVLALALGGEALQTETSVFGCPLEAPHTEGPE